MPTQHKQAKITLTAEEHERFSREAAGQSLSNYLRKRLGLPALAVGAEKGNQRAVGNKGRWQKSED